MTREDITIRILDAVSAELERIVAGRTADLCAEVHRLTTLLKADTRLLKSDLIRTGDENFASPTKEKINDGPTD